MIRLNSIVSSASNLLLYTTMFVCAIVSSYSTYLGFSEILTHNYFTISLAVCIGLLLLSLSYLIYMVHESDSPFFIRLFYLLLILTFIFCFSTIWSIVGMGNKELMQINVVNNSSEFAKKYSSSEFLEHFNNIERELQTARSRVEKSLHNAHNGLYTGIPKEGLISGIMSLLKDKTMSTQDELASAKAEVKEASDNLERYAKELRNWNARSDSGASYFNAGIGVNKALKTMKSVSVDSALISLSEDYRAAANTLREYTQKSTSQRTRTLLELEADSFVSVAESLDRARNNTIPEIASLDMDKLDSRAITLSFVYAGDIFNWWALCIALDAAPIVLMYILVRRREENAF